MNKNISDNENIFKLIFLLFKKIQVKRRKQLLLLIGFMIISGLSEFLTISSIIPYLFALSNSNIIFDLPYLSEPLSNLNITNERQLITLLTFTFVSLCIFSCIIRSYNFWLSNKLSSAIGSDLSIKCFKNILHQSYKDHIKQNTSETLNLIMTCINRTIIGIYCFLQVISNIFIGAFIFIALLIIDWKTILIGVSTFSSSYLLLGFATKKKIFINSKKIVSFTGLQVKSIQEGLGSIKDLILSGNFYIFENIFNKSDVIHRRLNAENRFLAVFPRYLLESLGLSLIAILGYLFLISGVEKELFIPLLGSIALGAQRLLPTMQQIYTNWSNLLGFKVDFIKVIEAINKKDISLFKVSGQTYIFKKTIKLKNIYFEYENKNESISNLNLEIYKGETIGIIGRTGSGKSTTVDILMGLLKPSKGNVLIDDKDLYDTNLDFLKNWRRSIAHVPQSIYLTDNSFLENIGFGIPKKDIDLKLAKRAAEESFISSYIESTDNGYDTFVGEYGVKLSGGQKQRIGIARAIYRIYIKSNINLIVLDEATSSLDSYTTSKIIKTFENKKELTKIIISHNLKSLEYCNRIIEITQKFR